MLQITNTKTQTMSSREIAGLTNKEHGHVMRDIRAIEAELGESISGCSSYLSEQNKEMPMLLLNKENSLLVVSGYSVALRKKIIMRWQELESNQIAQKELSRKDILLLALEAEERAEIAEARVERLVHSGRCHTTRQLAKEAGFKSAQELNAVLFNSKIIFKERGIWVLYSKYADKGYQEIKQQEFDNGHLGYTAEWTALGREFILDFCEKL